VTQEKKHTYKFILLSEDLKINKIRGEYTYNCVTFEKCISVYQINRLRKFYNKIQLCVCFIILLTILSHETILLKVVLK